jgi:hypothetical protein
VWFFRGQMLMAWPCDSFCAPMLERFCYVPKDLLRANVVLLPELVLVNIDGVCVGG